MKRHPVKFILIILIAVIAGYSIFNLSLPKYNDNYREKVVEIKGYNYEYRNDWVVVKKDKSVGRVMQDNYDFGTRLGLFFFPDRLYSAKGDRDNISYYIDPGISEFPWGHSIYRTDITLPNLKDMNPYKIEIALHDLDLSSKVYYVLEDQEIIDEILDVINTGDELQSNYSQEEKEALKKVNELYYAICFFDNRVPGSTYPLHIAKKEGYKAFYTPNDKKFEDELIDFTYVIHLLISNGEKVFD